MGSREGNMALEWLGEFLTRYPELALYLAVGLGYAIGSIKIRGFGLGPVTGSLVAGILLGQLGHIETSETARSILFLLFLYGIGYSVGPQFLSALRGDGAKTAALGILVPVVGLATAYAVARTLGFDPGFAAGLMSGGLTESTIIGTATDAIRHLPVPADQRDLLISHIIVADAVCYLFGTFGVIWMCGDLGPRILRIDLKAEAATLEAAMGIKRVKSTIIPGRRQFEIRAYRVPPDGPAVGKTVRETETQARDSRLFIHRIRRGGELLAATPELTLMADDIVAVSGRREVLVNLVGPGRVEVDDAELLDIPSTTLDVYVSNKAIIGRSIAEIAQSKSDWTRGVYLSKLARPGPRGRSEIPIAPGVRLQRGDILSLVGPETSLERIAPNIGTVIPTSESTNYVVLGLAIFLGGLFGTMIVLPVGDIHISLGASVGTLLAGLVTGHVHASRPTFGRIPEPVVSMMISFGLAAFVAMLGMRAGPVFFGALQREGLTLLFAGMVVTMTPQIVGLLVGRYLLNINPILLLGALSGAQTMTAGLAAVQQKSDSSVAVIGYTAAAPFGHILLTIWGTVIVWLMG
jgi:putative transport protein